MYCNYCRSSNPHDAVYCSACGRTIRSPVETTQNPADTEAGLEAGVAGTKEPTVTPISETEPQIQTEYSWELEKMNLEELEQLRASYQKLRITPSPALHAELERRTAMSDSLRATLPAQASESVPNPTSAPGPSQPEPKLPTRPAKSNRSAAAPGHLGSWVWMAIGTLIFTSLLGIGLFNFTWQLMVGDSEKAGESIGRMFIPVLLIGFSLVRARNSILKQEPKTNPTIRRRLRMFDVIGGFLTITILVSALALGVTAGARIEKNRKLNRTIDEMAKLGPKNAELRAEIKNILSKDTPTFEDYYLRSLKLEKVLDEYDLQQRRVAPLLNDLLANSADSPKVAEIAATVQRVNNKDAEVVELFRLEIAKGKELNKLPSSRQAVFYRQEIIPIEQQASKIADQEIEMLRDAEKKGLKWPSDVKEWLK